MGGSENHPGVLLRKYAQSGVGRRPDLGRPRSLEGHASAIEGLFSAWHRPGEMACRHGVRGQQYLGKLRPRVYSASRREELNRSNPVDQACVHWRFLAEVPRGCSTVRPGGRPRREQVKRGKPAPAANAGQPHGATQRHSATASTHQPAARGSEVRQQTVITPQPPRLRPTTNTKLAPTRTQPRATAG